MLLITDLISEHSSRIRSMNSDFEKKLNEKNQVLNETADLIIPTSMHSILFHGTEEEEAM